jgi:aspartate/methionine/tyrosine aminotransferase
MIIPEAYRLGSLGEYYFSTKLREIRKRKAAGEDIINLGIGNPDLPPSEETLRALYRSAAEPGNHGYQPYSGAPELRFAMAEWYLGSYGVKLDPEREILPLMGSKEGIVHISLAFLNPGDEVLVPDPGYPTYAAAAKLAGASARTYRLDAASGWLPDLDELESRDLSGIKIMWVNYPHMPTGAGAGKRTFDELVAFATRHRILLCNDNAYSLVLNPEPASLLAASGARDVAIELNSLSKSHNMAGWRLGLVAGNEACIRTVLKVKSNMDSGMFLPIQHAAIQALSYAPDWQRERNEIYLKRKEIIMQMLQRMGCRVTGSQAGLFVWAAIPAGQSSIGFSENLLNEAGVFFTPGTVFGEGGEGYIRASLCTPEDRLREAEARLFKQIPQIETTKDVSCI